MRQIRRPAPRRRQERGVLVVGQTPPPVFGQAVMVSALLDAHVPGVRLTHVRMLFSRRVGATGDWGVRKALHVPVVVGRIWRRRIVDHPEVLYYPPSGGGGLLPVLRDAVILGLTRPLFARTVLHFHASGLDDNLSRMPALLRRLVRRPLLNPDAAIHISPSAPAEGAALGARHCHLVPNGVPGPEGYGVHVRPEGPPLLTSVGLISPGKGAGRLVRLSGDLHARGIDHRLRLVGEVESADYQAELLRMAAELGVSDRLEFAGVLTGAEKWRALEETTVFCFPSAHHSETSPLVIIEAMAAGLPVVGSRWRGIPDLVQDGVTGFVVDVEDRPGWAAAVQQLLADPGLAERMGRAGRERYLERHTLDAFQRRMAEVLREVLDA